jgi:hypothetical protein
VGLHLYLLPLLLVANSLASCASPVVQNDIPTQSLPCRREHEVLSRYSCLIVLWT